MKELNYCSKCDEKLSRVDKDYNKEAGINTEEWVCWDCEMENGS
jgi:uncharacterized protein with PIN domain